tara:strand:+ start:797 stop:2092 length:1296 start_codon:yes stop_codon:yes gene_type:complete
MLDAKKAAQAAAQDVTPESLVDAFASDWSKERPAPVTQEQVVEDGPIEMPHWGEEALDTHEEGHAKGLAQYKALQDNKSADYVINWPEAGAEAAQVVMDKVLVNDEALRVAAQVAQVVEPVDEIDMLGKSPNIEVPTIGSSAVQVTVNFSQSAFRRLDRKESEKVTTANGAIKKAASVHKSLLPQCEQLTAIHLFVGRSRTAHYSMTLPWCDKGPRLLPTANLAAFHEHITGIQDKFNELCEAFYAVYPWEVAEAEAARGGAGTLTNDRNGQFDTSLYPPLEEVRKKFKMSIAYMPVPERGGFITDLQADASVMVNDHYDEFYRSATSSAMNEVWKKLYVPLQNMSERLDYPTRKENTKFRDTLVSNVMDIVSLLKVFNITNDPHLEACRVKLEEALYGVTPDGLRDDDTFRAQTKRSVDAVLKTLPSIDL